MAAKRRLSGTAIARRPVPVLPDVLMRRIDADPSFQVMTVDGLHWIEPFTAQLIPAGIGRAAAAREWLAGHPDRWRDREPLPHGELELVRVQHDLARRVEAGNPFYDPRFCLFANADLGLGWLNPCTGEFVASVQRQDGRITPRTLNAMARVLVADPDFRAGRMHDLNGLRVKAQAIVAQMRGTGRFTAAAMPQTPTPAGGASVLPPAQDDDLTRARQVQDQLLPDLPALDGYDIGVHFTPHHGVSGDFYEALTLRDGRVLLAVGDVSGHGMQAALVVASALKTLRLLARDCGELARLIAAFNDEIKPDLPPGEFLTLVVALLSPDTREVEVMRAGHHAPLLANIARPQILRRCGGSGMAIGLAMGESFARTLRTERLTLEPGDTLVLYTDGLAEADHPELGQFGEHRVCGKLLEHIESGAQEIADAMAEAGSRHASGQSADDVTVLVLSSLDREADEAETESPAE